MPRVYSALSRTPDRIWTYEQQLANAIAQAEWRINDPHFNRLMQLYRIVRSRMNEGFAVSDDIREKIEEIENGFVRRS